MLIIVGYGYLIFIAGALLSGELTLGIWLMSFPYAENKIIPFLQKRYTWLKVKIAIYPSRALMCLVAAYLLWRTPHQIAATGLAVAAIGVLLNFLVNTANGMKMPAQIEDVEEIEGNTEEYVPLGESRLRWLGDWIPTINGFASVGDVLHALGVWTATIDVFHALIIGYMN